MGAAVVLLPGDDEPGPLQDVRQGLARYGEDEPRAVPEGGQRVVGFDLTVRAPKSVSVWWGSLALS